MPFGLCLTNLGVWVPPGPAAPGARVSCLNLATARSGVAGALATGGKLPKL